MKYSHTSLKQELLKRVTKPYVQRCLNADGLQSTTFIVITDTKNQVLRCNSYGNRCGGHGIQLHQDYAKIGFIYTRY